jgi:hypothetical protein
VDKIIDPVLLTPGTAQEGVDNSDISGITDEDLLAMEKLPMAKYYKIVHPEEEGEEGKGKMSVSMSHTRHTLESH